MERELSYRAEQSLKTLNIKIGLNQQWNIKIKSGSFTMDARLNWADYKISPNRKILAQSILLNWWHAECIDGNYILNSEIYRRYATLLRILLISESLFPNIMLCELEKRDWIEIAFRALFKAWGKNNRNVPVLKDTAQPLAVQMLVRSVGIIKEWYNLYHSGDVSDGPEFIISTTDIENLIKPDLEKVGRTLHDWKEGGSHGTIPFSIAHLMLTDAISIIDSDRTKQLLAYFSFVKQNNVHHLVKPFWKSNGATPIAQYRSTGDLTLVGPNSLTDARVSIDCKKKFVWPLHEKLMLLHHPDKKFKFPWLTYSDVVRQHNELLTAIYVVFLSVMGKRGPSEIQSFRALDISPANKDIGADAVMMPSIEKTNKGLRDHQGVTNFIDRALDTILALGYLDKKAENHYLFTSIFNVTKVADAPPVRISQSQMSSLLKTYFNDFCDRSSLVVDFNIKDLHSSIKSHQFRHAFAEFALRRFDGSVEELIRQHFCHTYQHWWTKRYTSDKLDADREQYMSKEYIRELVPRILNDPAIDQDFVGGMALFIKREVGLKIKSMTASDAEKYIAQFCTNIIQITAHEYGWCLLHEQYRSIAKCADNKGNPNPSATSSSKCIGCANFCASRKSHLEVQKQIAISHIDFIESKVWKMKSLKDASISAVHNAQKLFPELKELGIVE